MKRFILLLLLSGCADKLNEVNYKINQHPYSANYDCKNFAEEKYKALIKNGYKSKQMKFVITFYQDKPHVVLNVDGWILDNNYKYPYQATKDMHVGLDYYHWNYYRKGI